MIKKIRNLFQKEKYLCLIKQKQNALKINENIDNIYINVFNSIDLSKNHTIKEYRNLLYFLELRHNNDNPKTILDVNEVFPLELICCVAMKLHSESPLITWEIIYRMIQLYVPSYGCDSTLLYTLLQRLEDKIDYRGNRVYGILSTVSILITSEEKSFGYICFLLDMLRKHLDLVMSFTSIHYYYTPFTDQILLNKQNSLRRLLENEKHGFKNVRFILPCTI